ncbi:hypothetical protein, partial [Aestuariispira insulae]|uniref:hypothetical protein n=1 Tax=Aestuariispira insulae TaxID=1461337 RepID=UPI001C3FCFEA
VCFDGLVRTVIKTGNSHSFKEAVSDQIATTSIEGIEGAGRRLACFRHNTPRPLHHSPGRY